MSDTLVNMFAYGSNMCEQRLRARIANVTRLTVGYVTHRRIAFHKRGIDGSAKADAVYTGCISDRVWGVVFALSREDQRVLSGYERDYEEAEVVVNGNPGVFSAITYVARSDAIDPSLRPFSWYHRFVIHGARQHQLPLDYLQHLQTIPSIADFDDERHQRNAKLIGSSS